MSAPTSPAQHSRRAARAPRGPLVNSDVRRTLLAALAAALGVVPLKELFLGSSWLIDAWLTIVVVVAPAAILRRTRRASAGQIWIGVVLLVPWLTVRFVRENAVLGFLPLQGSWHDIGTLLHQLHETSTNEVAPVPASVAVRLAVCALLGLVTALIDLIAVVGRRGALAGVPLLAVFTVSGAVPRHPVSWAWFVFSALGFLLLLGLDSSDDRQRWGHLVPRTRASTPRRAWSAAAPRIAVLAVALAVILPAALPANSGNVISSLFHGHNGSGGPDPFGRGGGSGTQGIDPFAALKGQLDQPKNTPLLDVSLTPPPGRTVASLRVFYLRTNVLSLFTGKGWVPGETGDPQSLATTRFASEPGTAFAPDPTTSFGADITISGLNSNPPIFGSPVQVSGVDPSTEWDPRDSLLVGPATSSGQVIHEEVSQPDPSVDQLRAATSDDPSMSYFRQLPDINPFVRRTTLRVIRNADTPYDRARAIFQYFRGTGFAYTLSTVAGDSGDDLTDFLKNKSGYCQQYAAAMAVMLRIAGVPSRVVLGYAHSVPNKNGMFAVGTLDAHAWTEAYFAGIGWVPFDATPLVGTPGASQSQPQYTLPTAAATKGRGSPTARTSTPRVRTDFPTVGNGETTPPKNSGSRPAARSQSGPGLVLPVLVGLIVVLVIAMLLVPAAVRLWRRRARRHSIRHGDADALWAELSDSATDLGYVWSDARTPRQVATWLVTASNGSADLQAVRMLTGAVEQARYAPAPASSWDGNELLSGLDTVTDGLRAHRSTSDRWRARLWPASLGWTRRIDLARLLRPGSRRH